MNYKKEDPLFSLGRSHGAWWVRSALPEDCRLAGKVTENHRIIMIPTEEDSNRTDSNSEASNLGFVIRTGV